jgi:hypothetical protein
MSGIAADAYLSGILGAVNYAQLPSAPKAAIIMALNAAPRAQWYGVIFGGTAGMAPAPTLQNPCLTAGTANGG